VSLDELLAERDRLREQVAERDAHLRRWVELAHQGAPGTAVLLWLEHGGESPWARLEVEARQLRGQLSVELAAVAMLREELAEARAKLATSHAREDELVSELAQARAATRPTP